VKKESVNQAHSPETLQRTLRDLFRRRGALSLCRSRARCANSSRVGRTYGDAKVANRDINKVWHWRDRKGSYGRWTNPKPLQPIWDRAAI
jgi:hypothetical protein